MLTDYAKAAGLLTASEDTVSYTHLDDGRRIQPVEGVDRYAMVAAPIVAAGDVCGSILLLAGEGGGPAGDTEVKLIAAAAAFLGKQMEE